MSVGQLIELQICQECGRQFRPKRRWPKRKFCCMACGDRASRRNQLAKGHARLRSVLENSACVRCGESDARVLVFHHKDPSKPHGSVAAAAMGSKATFEAEIAKTVVICRNCHTIVHWEIEHPMQETST